LLRNDQNLVAQTKNCNVFEESFESQENNQLEALKSKPADGMAPNKDLDQLLEATKKGKKLDITRLANRITNIDAKDPSGKSVLHAAIENNQWDAAEILLDLGADIDVQDEKTGYTPLYMACMKVDLDLVKLLLSRGADPSLPAIDGTFPGDKFETNIHNDEIKTSITEILAKGKEYLPLEYMKHSRSKLLKTKDELMKKENEIARLKLQNQECAAELVKSRQECQRISKSYTAKCREEFKAQSSTEPSTYKETLKLKQRIKALEEELCKRKVDVHRSNQIFVDNEENKFGKEKAQVLNKLKLLLEVKERHMKKERELTSMKLRESTKYWKAKAEEASVAGYIVVVFLMILIFAELNISESEFLFVL